MYTFGASLDYLLTIILFIIFCIIYWIIYDRYTMKVIRREQVKFKLPDKRVVIGFSTIITLILMVVLSIQVTNKIKKVYDEHKEFTFVGYVAVGDKFGVRQFLFDHPDFNINTTDALYVSVRSSDEEMTQLLIDYGADIHQTFIINELSLITSPLFVAISNNDYDMTKFLLEKGANPNQFNDPYDYQNNALYLAIHHENLELMKLLVEYNANLMLGTFNTDYLEEAARKGNKEIFEYLLNQGLQINRNKERNVLDEAVMSHHYDFAEYLIEEHKLKMTPYILRDVIMFMVDDFEEAIDYCISKGVHFNDLYYDRPLWMYSLQSFDSVNRLKYFKSLGVDLNVKNQSGQNLIHLSVMLNPFSPDTSGIDYLVNEGINPHEVDQYGKKPIDYTLDPGISERHEEIYQEYLKLFNLYQ